MKEQIIAIMGKHIKCTDEWGSLTGFSECADEIMQMAEFEELCKPDYAEMHMNDSVFKQNVNDAIAEKMPSEEETIVEAENLYPTVYKNDGLNKIDDAYNHMQLDKRIGFKQGCEWFRNRMEESK